MRQVHHLYDRAPVGRISKKFLFLCLNFKLGVRPTQPLGEIGEVPISVKEQCASAVVLARTRNATLFPRKDVRAWTHYIFIKDICKGHAVDNPCPIRTRSNARMGITRVLT